MKAAGEAAYSAAKQARAAARGQGQAEQAEFDPSGCAAHGCQCRGTIDVGGAGRYFCQWHAWASPEKWPAITDALRAEAWFVDLIGELERIYRAAGKGKPWAAYAATQLRDYPDLQPQPVELHSWNFYTWRLREELAHRVGVRKDRPLVRTPQHVEWAAAS